MSKALREKIVRELAGKYSPVDCCVFVNFNGLSSEIMNQLRRALRQKMVVLSVQKNSLLKLALKEASKPFKEDFFISPTAVAVGGESPFELFRALLEWERKSGKLKVKGGFLQGTVLTGNDVLSLSEIPSREALLGRVSGSVKYPAVRIACCISSVLSRICCALKAYSQKLEQAEQK